MIKLIFWGLTGIFFSLIAYPVGWWMDLTIWFSDAVNNIADYAECRYALMTEIHPEQRLMYSLWRDRGWIK
jgi:hypothetical protein